MIDEKECVERSTNPFPQVTLDTDKAFDLIHLRNTYIRAMNSALKDHEIAYNERINYLSRKWFASPKTIEQIIQNYPHKK
jgi:hypothetical protein